MEKYDKSYKRDPSPLFIGIGIIILNIYFFNFDNSIKESRNEFLVGVLVVRILLAVYIHQISELLNRQGHWELFCFFFPAIALISIYFKKKIRLGYHDLKQIHVSLRNDYENDITLLEKAYNDKLMDKQQVDKAFKDILLKYLGITEALDKEKTKVEISDLRNQLEILREKGFLSPEEFNDRIKSLQDE